MADSLSLTQCVCARLFRVGFASKVATRLLTHYWYITALSHLATTITVFMFIDENYKTVYDVKASAFVTFLTVTKQVHWLLLNGWPS